MRVSAAKNVSVRAMKEVVCRVDAIYAYLRRAIGDKNWVWEDQAS